MFLIFLYEIDRKLLRSISQFIARQLGKSSSASWRLLRPWAGLSTLFLPIKYFYMYWIWNHGYL